MILHAERAALVGHVVHRLDRPQRRGPCRQPDDRSAAAIRLFHDRSARGGGDGAGRWIDGRCARGTDRAALLDPDGHRVGGGGAAPAALVRPRGSLERPAARDPADRAPAAGDATTAWRSATTHSTCPASRSMRPSTSASRRSRRVSTLSLLMPSDGTDGIAQTSPIAVFFDRPIDPDSLSDDVAHASLPTVAGSLDLVDELGDEPADAEDGRVLRFTPSGPLPANTTFEVVLPPGVTGTGRRRAGGAAVVDLHHRRPAHDALEPDHVPDRSVRSRRTSGR